MARVFVTGSSQGLGLMAAQRLAAAGHAVVLHARGEARAESTRRALPGAEAVLVADVSTLAAMRALAGQANATGRFDAVIHNVAIGYREKRRVVTADGLSQLWVVNVLAPYVLTALIERPDRLIYLSSELHRRVDGALDDLHWERRVARRPRLFGDQVPGCAAGNGGGAALAGVLANAVEPGWVPTRMGGPRASGDLAAGAETQGWLAVSDDPAARVTGDYFFHRRRARLHPAADRADLQEALLARCAAASGIALP